jgi:hypothetical protein
MGTRLFEGALGHGHNGNPVRPLRISVRLTSELRDLALQATSWVEDFLTEFAKGYCARASDEFWPYPGLSSQNKGRLRTLHTPRTNKQQIKIVARANRH